MKVVIKGSVRFNGARYSSGSVVDMPDDEASRLIRLKAAESVSDDVKPETEHAKQPEQTEQNEYPEKEEQAKQPDQAEQPGQMKQPEETDQAKQPEKPENEKVSSAGKKSKRSRKNED